MHVLQLGPYPPPEGGVSRNMLAIHDELTARGHICSIIATTRGIPEPPANNVLRPTTLIEFLRLLRSINCDVLHLHVGGEVSSRVIGLMLACTTAGKGKKVLSVHSGAFPLSRAALRAKPWSFRSLIFRRFDRIIVPNAAIESVFISYGIARQNVRMIMPYVLLEPDERVSLPERFQRFCGDHSPVLLSVGGLEPDYDPMFQINSMKEILAEFPNAGLILAGDGSMRAEVEKAVAGSEYSERICVAGNVEHPTTLHLIRGADVLIRTTLFDGDSISIREALFLRTPVVATDNGMRPNGVHVFDVGRTNEFTSAVREALERAPVSRTEESASRSNISDVIELYSELQ